MTNLRDKLTAAISRIERQDAKLAEELRDRRKEVQEKVATQFNEVMFESAVAGSAEEPRPEGLARTAEAADDAGERQLLVRETIVLRYGRPVLAIVNDEARLEFREGESEVWRERLTSARSELVAAAQAVGRIQVTGHPSFQWLGTGWLVGPETIVTNRHVAREFGRRHGEGFDFKIGLGIQQMAATIDFLKEVGRADGLEFKLRKILHIEEEDGPDLALLRVEPSGHALAPKIRLAKTMPEEGQQVAVIGYPARDSRIPEQELMEQVFGNVYDKKRLAPGQVLPTGPGGLRHDCSTLGGNSGSVVLDLKSGDALALHFAGRFLEANFAVPAAIIDDRLTRFDRDGSRRPQRPGTGGSSSGPAQPQTPGIPAAVQTAVQASSPAGVTFTVPIRISVEVGTPEPAANASTGDAAAPGPPAAGTGKGGPDDVIVETRPEDYDGRDGYRPDFLGLEVPLPAVTKGTTDVLRYSYRGQEDSELRYQHFSVVMSRSRRLCRFSAVNINGKTSRRSRRPGWRTDPRIPATAQILKECYGEAPKFSRGHMTRREDPVWGEEQEAGLGNRDSMHVTNTVPQMQVFNAGVWLALEDYALENARQDDMRISVFTGPFLLAEDPVRFGVKIPVSFWKVIAFIHDQTGKLCATGYSMSQEAVLTGREFVFGRHETTQTPVASIQTRAGLFFGPLAELDPLARVEESFAQPLTDPNQICFF